MTTATNPTSVAAAPAATPGDAPAAALAAAPAATPGSALAAALLRWGVAAARLGLEGPGAAAGAILLSAELDEDARGQIIQADARAVAPRRIDVLRALAAGFGEERAAAGLTALEARGVAAPLRSYDGPWFAAELELDRRVRAYCLSSPPRLPPPPPYPHPLARVELALQQALDRAAGSARRFLFLIRGRTGSGRDAVLERLLAGLGTPSLQKTPHDLRQPHDPLEPELSGSAAVWDPRRTDPSPDDYDLARRWLGRSPGAAVVLVDRHQDAPDVDARIVLPIDVDPVDTDERRLGWEAALGETPAPRPMIEAAAHRLARRSRAGVGLAVRAAQMIGDRVPPQADDLVLAAELQLAALVRPSTTRGILVERPTVALNRVISPTHLLDALRQVVLLGRLSTEVETPGRVGVKALFSGPSGTGKTMAARAIAAELALPLYRVDLSGVVSKWVGETEKNLREALAAAEASGAVLLFDEGDALFGKRGEVSRGADRYANTEVAYLLQAVEAYDGIAIVTTNVRNNVDKAFERRFDACIEFQPPTPLERATIWRQELGEAGLKLSPALVTDISKRADLHGGSIAAAARVARVLSLHRGGSSVAEEDLRAAVRAELLKSGSSVQASRWTKNES
jgi:hypothetical protein